MPHMKVSGAARDKEGAVGNHGKVQLDYSSPWRKSFLHHREKLSSSLHILHPSMQELLKLSRSLLGNLVIADYSTIRYLNQCFALACIRKYVFISMALI